MRPNTILLTAILAGASLVPLSGMAGDEVFEIGSGSIKFSGDLRFRIEEDWDSRRGDGTERDDRTRARTRMRVRLDAQIDDYWSAVFRIRSGSDDSQQGPHITIYDFEGNDTGDADFNFDLWYGQYKNEGLVVAAGRKQINLWRQDDNVFTHDVTRHTNNIAPTPHFSN